MIVRAVVLVRAARIVAAALYLVTRDAVSGHRFAKSRWSVWVPSRNGMQSTDSTAVRPLLSKTVPAVGEVGLEVAGLLVEFAEA